MTQIEKYARLRGNMNPMRRPEVAAKQSASLKAHYAQGKDKRRKVVWTDEMRQRRSEATKQMWAEKKGRSQPWTEERKDIQRARMQAYWAKVKAALELMGESQHAANNPTN